MSELKENFKKGWLDEDPRIVAAALLAILTFIVLNILLRKSQKSKKNLKQQAIDNNTVIEARLISRHRNHDSDSYSGSYKFTVNGKTMSYSIDSEFNVPDTINLYPKNSSMTKFFSDYDRTSNAGIAFNALAAIAVCVIVLLVTRYPS